MADRLDLEQLRESVRRMGPNWVETDPNFDVSWWSIPDRDFQSFADAARFLLSLLDEGGRLVVEQPCEHGDDWLTCDTEDCPGGSRKVIWPEEEE